MFWVVGLFSRLIRPEPEGDGGPFPLPPPLPPLPGKLKPKQLWRSARPGVFSSSYDPAGFDEAWRLLATKVGRLLGALELEDAYASSRRRAGE